MWFPLLHQKKRNTPLHDPKFHSLVGRFGAERSAVEKITIEIVGHQVQTIRTEDEKTDLSREQCLC